MALPKVKNRDIVDITFKNHTKMYVDSDNDIYTSSKYNRESLVDYRRTGFILKGGKAVIDSSDKHAICLFMENADRYDEDTIRVERKFIDSLKIVNRPTIIPLSNEWEVRIPSDPKEDLGLHEVGDHYSEDEFTPATVKKFLKKFKATYLTKKKAKKKAKKKKAKKLPKAMDKGTKITKSKWKDGMLVNLESIDWDESANGLTPLELYFVFKGKLKNVEIQLWDPDGNPRIKDPFWDGPMSHWTPLSHELIQSMTLAKDWKPTPPPEPEIDPDDERFGKDLGSTSLGHRTMHLSENIVSIGCQEFELKTMKKLYKELVKVYGEPK